MVVGSTDPDLVLVDVVLLDAVGILLCDDLRETMPHLGCIVLSTYVDQEALARAEQARIAGYLSKDTRGEVLVEAVRQAVRTGRIELGGRVQVLHLVTQARRERGRSPTPRLPRSRGLPEPEAAAGR